MKELGRFPRFLPDAVVGSSEQNAVELYGDRRLTTLQIR